MIKIVGKLLSIVLFWIILKSYQLLTWFGRLLIHVKDYIRCIVFKMQYENEHNVITQEIKPRINKKMDHVALCCLQTMHANADQQAEIIWKLIEWLLVCEVKYITMYFEHMDTLNLLDLQKYVQNTLKGKFNSNTLCWAGDSDRSDSAETIINTLAKEQIDKNMNDTLTKFWREEPPVGSTDTEEASMRVVNYAKDHLEIYQPTRGWSRRVMDPTKTWFEQNNPDLILLFNSREFSLGGFPFLMREFAEILHCGQLHKLNILKFYDVMCRFFDIEKRWGI